jgi:dienelactone hydrolase
MPVQAGGLEGAGMARSELARVEAPEVVLAGTLHQPAGARPHPAMVMLQGSGVADRESGGFFPPIRAAFLDAGVGVLSWDKPGVGESSGDWRERTLFDRADEALAAIAWLREHPAVDAGRVGITGSG